MAAMFPSCTSTGNRTRIHPCVIAAQHLMCWRPPDLAYACQEHWRHAVKNGLLLFFGLHSPGHKRSHKRSVRGGLQPQQRRADSASAFPTLRSCNQLDMPEGSEEDERLDERRSRTRSPPAARGGARRSYDSYGSNTQVRQGKFSTDDVPNVSTIRQFWVKTREDWPGFFWQLINT